MMQLDIDVPEQFRDTVAALPVSLRALLLAELAAGNSIAELGHSHPAPPVGAYLRLSRPVTTAAHTSAQGLTFRARNSSLYSGEFSDGGGRYFILEPPLPEPPEPDMDAIRERANPPPSLPSIPSHTLALARFFDSMRMDYDKWHDGIGYDLDALNAVESRERAAIETSLIHQSPMDWRAVEALAMLDTPRARAALRRVFEHGDAQERAAVLRHAPALVDNDARSVALVDALKTAQFFGALSQTLDLVADYHPPAVVEALFQGLTQREGDVAVHFAAMLLYIHGRADEPFDMAKRPFFLRFNTDDERARAQAVRDLRAMLEEDAP